MLEALWSVEFVSNLQGVGAGVAVLETGRILGGDGQYYYVGSYRVENGTAFAEVEVTHYSGPPSSIFGLAKKFTLSLSGRPDRERFELHGNVVESPQLRIGLRLTRRAELP
ncbi:MAG: hypothetical protein AMXMBFR72_32160 [Betaproteobacteria bacterium]|jgi:hypothetical protein